MLNNNKSETEKRFELFISGLLLMTAAVCFILFWETSLRGMLLFMPGLILLGSAIFQDMQPGWFAGMVTYIFAALLVGTGLALLINALLGDVVPVPGWLWIMITIVELGAVMVAKALYDPTLGRTP
jgi:hypothetical protein